MATVNIGIGDCKVSSNSCDELVTHGLGSCIAVMVHDPVARVSGLLHFMLPESSLDLDKAAKRPHMFADTGIPKLFQSAYQLGAVKQRMIVMAAGGAQMLDPHGTFNIGKRNHLEMRKIFWKAGVVVKREEVGGSTSRNREDGCGTGQSTAVYAGTSTSRHDSGDTKWRIVMAFSVLIVDDSPVMRRMIRRVVDMSGVDVGTCLEACNGREALAVLRAEWVDIVLTDINMPEMNGEELLIELRKDPGLASVPVLVVSTDQSVSRIEHMMSQGASGYLPKPFMPGDLCSEMYRLLGGPSDESF